MAKRGSEDSADIVYHLQRVRAICDSICRVVLSTPDWLILLSPYVLLAVRNSLTRDTSFGHLLNLESLDISRNNIDSLTRKPRSICSVRLCVPLAVHFTELGCLRHLHELRADGNKITSLDGLQHMNTLVKLSLQGNSIDNVDFTQCSWCAPSKHVFLFGLL